MSPPGMPPLWNAPATVTVPSPWRVALAASSVPVARVAPFEKVRMLAGPPRKTPPGAASAATLTSVNSGTTAVSPAPGTRPQSQCRGSCQLPRLPPS